jgi:hypothetical protein
MPASLLDFLAGGLFQAGWVTLLAYFLAATWVDSCLPRRMIRPARGRIRSRSRT